MHRTDKETDLLFEKISNIHRKNNGQLTLHFFDGTKLETRFKKADRNSITVFTTNINKTVTYDLSQIKDVS